MIMQPRQIHQRVVRSDEMVVVPDDPPTRQEVIDQLDADAVRRFLIMLDVDMD